MSVSQEVTIAFDQMAAASAVINYSTSGSHLIKSSSNLLRYRHYILHVNEILSSSILMMIVFHSHVECGISF